MNLILTGPTRDHKTTTLMEWSGRQSDCGGVLSPDVDGLRVLYNIRTRQSIPWQKKMPEDEHDLIVGRFTFDADAFETGKAWLTGHFLDPAVRTIIIDEIGPLELDGKGWAPWLHMHLGEMGDKALILVVRRPLLDDVINYFGLSEVSVVEKQYFSVS